MLSIVSRRHNGFKSPDAAHIHGLRADREDSPLTRRGRVRSVALCLAMGQSRARARIVRSPF